MKNAIATILTIIMTVQFAFGFQTNKAPRRYAFTESNVFNIHSTSSSTSCKVLQDIGRRKSRSVKRMQLFSNISQDYDGFGRGKYILGLVFLLCVWSFSIPPEFRRAHICTNNICVEHRAYCYDCVTVKEWANDVANYYKSGGGITFDFSIDPATKEFWRQRGR